MIWADAVYVNLARKTVYTTALKAIEEGTPVSSLLKGLHRKILIAAANPKRSTSVSHNYMDQAEATATAMLWEDIQMYCPELNEQMSFTQK